MAFKVFPVIALSAVLFFCHGNAQCPQSFAEVDPLRRWLADSVGMCYTEMMASLRQSTGECSPKVYGVTDCLNGEADKCITEDTNDMLKMIIQQSLGPFSSTLPMFDQIFCFGNISSLTHLTPSVEFGPEQQCSSELGPTSAACASSFDQTFAANPLNPRLCTDFDTVVECQTEKVRQYCPNIEEDVVANDIYLRQKMNFFCGGVDESAIGGASTKAPGGGGDTISDDDDPSSAVKSSTKAPGGGGDTISDDDDPSSAVTAHASVLLFTLAAFLFTLL